MLGRFIFSRFPMLQKILTRFKAILSPLEKHPILGFFGLLAMLFGVIVLSYHLRTPQLSDEPATPEKKVTAVFDIAHDTARLSVSAQVRKENVIQIVALAPAIVSRINTLPGRVVSAGQTLIALTNDFGSDNAALQRAIARNDAALTAALAKKDQKLIKLQKKQVKQDPTITTSLQESIQIEQLKRQRVILQNTLENNPLRLKLAEQNDTVLNPKTPVAGIVESVPVRVGDFVPAGAILATIHADHGAITAEALVSQKTALLFTPAIGTELNQGAETAELFPTYFSREDTHNGLYSILFTLPQTFKASTTSGQFLTIELPLVSAANQMTLVPIDAVFQDDTGARVLLEQDGLAVSRAVSLGTVYGSFIEISSGLASEARLILNRSVIAGDHVTIQ